MAIDAPGKTEGPPISAPKSAFHPPTDEQIGRWNEMMAAFDKGGEILDAWRNQQRAKKQTGQATPVASAPQPPTIEVLTPEDRAQVTMHEAHGVVATLRGQMQIDADAKKTALEKKFILLRPLYRWLWRNK